MAEVLRTWLCDDAYVFFRDGFSVVLVVNAENLCQSVILAAIKEYSLYANVVKLIIIRWSFLPVLLRFRRFLLRSITLDRSMGETRPRSCRTDVANTTADLSETLLRSHAVVSKGREIVFFALVFWLWFSLD